MMKASLTSARRLTRAPVDLSGLGRGGRNGPGFHGDGERLETVLKAGPVHRELVRARTPTVEVVVPVLNEAHILERSVAMLCDFLRNRFPYPARIVIANNGSTDSTKEVAERLTRVHENVDCLFLPEAGRGRAIRSAWTLSTADIVAYTDVDLSTGLEALEPLCRAIHEEGYDIAIGSRLMRASRVRRGIKREVISRLYNLLLKGVLSTHFTDAQCGFKAVSRRVVEEVVPQVQHQGWFFDTELLVRAEKEGYRIKDVAVQWVDDFESRVKILPTAWEDLEGVLSMHRWLRRRERGGSPRTTEVPHGPFDHGRTGHGRQPRSTEDPVERGQSVVWDSLPKDDGGFVR